MVKIGRRFFFNQTFQRKKRNSTILAIILVIIIIAGTFAIVTYFHNKPVKAKKPYYVVKSKKEVEINTAMPSILEFFSSLENIALSDISISYDKNFTYQENLDKCSDEEKALIEKIRTENKEDTKGSDPFACIAIIPDKLGTYEITINILDKKVKTKLVVVDKTAPDFETKDLTISNEESYNVKSFVTSCTDNSKEECIIDFYTPLRGEKIDYGSYKEPGEYIVKIIAKDRSGNTSNPKEAKLVIKETKYYTVTFNSNGGTNVDNQRIKEGLTAYSPYPERSGYTFNGWYNGNSKFDFNTPITSDLNLTASWSKINNNQNNNYNNNNNNSNTESKCSYGKYSDYYGTVSVYAYIINGKGINDCADKNNGEDQNYYAVRNTLLSTVDRMTRRNTGELDLDIRKQVGGAAEVLFRTTTEHIVNNNGGFVGFYATVEAISSGKTIKTYTLYNCTTTSCKWR